MYRNHYACSCGAHFLATHDYIQNEECPRCKETIGPKFSVPTTIEDYHNPKKTADLIEATNENRTQH